MRIIAFFVGAIIIDEVVYPASYVFPYKFPKEIQTLKKKIESDFDCKFNACLIGLFDDPSLKIGFHSDAR